MKKYFNKFVLTFALSLLLAVGAAVPAMAAEVPPDPELPMSTILRKTLEMPEGVAVPEGGLTFTFNFAPVAPNAIAIPHGGAGPVQITIPAGATGSATQFIDLTGIFSQIATDQPDNLQAGPREWIVTEVAGSSSNPDVTYDTSSYRLIVHFRNILPINGGGISVAAVEVWTMEPADYPDPGDYEPTKLEEMHFINELYPDAAPFIVSKTIDDNWEHADLTTPFTFEATLTAPVMPAPLTSPTLPGPTFTAEIFTFDHAAETTVSVGTVGFTTSADGTTATPTAGSFQLRHGEWLSFGHTAANSLPAGTTFIVTEVEPEDFTARAAVIEGGAPGMTGTAAGVGYSLTMSGTIYADGPNAADFTNDFFWVPITGLVLNNLPIFALALALIAVLLMLSSRNRRRIEEMPVAA